MTTNDTQPIERVGKKQQKNLTVSPELAGTLDSLIGWGNRSEFVERAVWYQLIEQCGEAAVRDEIERVQSDIEAHNRLPDEKTEETLPI